MLQQRSDKNSHLDPVLCEIDMLRHCSKTLAAQKAKKSESEEAVAEYNRGIEGFLIRLRNLPLSSRLSTSRNTDLRLDRPDAGGPLKPGFGLSGAVLLLDKGLAAALSSFRLVYFDSTSSINSQSFAGWTDPNIPTLNFAKNAKFRMGHASP